MSGATCAIFMMIFNLSSDKNTLRRPAGNRSPSRYRSIPGQDLAILPNRAEWSLFYFEHSIRDSVAFFRLRGFSRPHSGRNPAVGDKT